MYVAFASGVENTGKTEIYRVTAGKHQGYIGLENRAEFYM